MKEQLKSGNASSIKKDVKIKELFQAYGATVPRVVYVESQSKKHVISTSAERPSKNERSDSI